MMVLPCMDIDMKRQEVDYISGFCSDHSVICSPPVLKMQWEERINTCIFMKQNLTQIPHREVEMNWVRSNTQQCGPEHPGKHYYE